MKALSNHNRTPGKRIKLGELLVKAGLIDGKTLASALEIQQIQKKKIGQVLIEMGVADDVEIAKALARQLRVPLVRIDKIRVAKEILSLVPAALAENYLLVPLKEYKKKLVVAMANPLDFHALDDLRFVTQMPIAVTVSPQQDILIAIDRLYPKKALEKDMLAGAEAGESIEIVQQVDTEEKDAFELLKLTELPPVVRFANAILGDAIKMNASDVHVEPQKDKVIVRYRIDGVMREILTTDKHVHASLISRIKIISNMDITIRRMPQDGRSQIRWNGKSYDLRVSTIPTSYGEKVTIRILNPASPGQQIEDLGLSARAYEDFIEAIRQPQGIILVTGPTGSGKSSTLYACLNRLNSPEVNIITVEDPVEFDINGINQVQIDPKAGISFAAGLRSILRQDPDIVMVGEIRDRETAVTAFQAAQTGHLVLSTLHTNDAAAAVARLLDLGIEDFMISASLVVVVAQRLVRKICPHCKAPHPLGPQLAKQVKACQAGEQDGDFWKGAGCEACQYTGYAGRLGIFEVFRITPQIRGLISASVDVTELKKAAKLQGFENMLADGLSKARQGMTTVEEVLRVVPPDDADTPPLSAPAQPAATTTDPVTSQDPQTPGITSARSDKILIADDSEIILQLLSNVLESENFRIITAANGREALRLAMQERPDLIVTDLLMPEMDGITLIKS